MNRSISSAMSIPFLTTGVKRKQAHIPCGSRFRWDVWYRRWGLEPTRGHLNGGVRRVHHSGANSGAKDVDTIPRVTNLAPHLIRAMRRRNNFVPIETSSAGPVSCGRWGATIQKPLM